MCDLYTAGCISPDPQHDGVYRQEIYGRICSDGRQESETFYHNPASADRERLPPPLYPEFFLAFTDFGIPASVGGQYEVLASLLYDEMLGSIPDFNKGAVIAMVMLVPSVLSILLLHYLERYNVRYNKISAVENEEKPDTGRLLRDFLRHTPRCDASDLRRHFPCAFCAGIGISAYIYNGTCAEVFQRPGSCRSL